MHAEAIRQLLPWRRPFMTLDRLIDWEAHRRIQTVKQVGADDPVVPAATGDGCYPQLMLLEGMSQSAALLYRLTYGESAASRLPMLGFLKSSWSTTVARCGDTVTYEVDAVKMTMDGGVFEARARVSDETLARAELAFATTEQR